MAPWSLHFRVADASTLQTVSTEFYKKQASSCAFSEKFLYALRRGIFLEHTLIRISTVLIPLSSKRLKYYSPSFFSWKIKGEILSKKIYPFYIVVAFTSFNLLYLIVLLKGESPKAHEWCVQAKTLLLDFIEKIELPNW